MVKRGDRPYKKPSAGAPPEEARRQARRLPPPEQSKFKSRRKEPGQPAEAGNTGGRSADYPPRERKFQRGRAEAPAVSVSLSQKMLELAEELAAEAGMPIRVYLNELLKYALLAHGRRLGKHEKYLPEFTRKSRKRVSTWKPDSGVATTGDIPLAKTAEQEDARPAAAPGKPGFSGGQGKFAGGPGKPEFAGRKRKFAGGPGKPEFAGGPGKPGGGKGRYGGGKSKFTRPAGAGKRKKRSW